MSELIDKEGNFIKMHAMELYKKFKFTHLSLLFILLFISYPSRRNYEQTNQV
jgi:uncharacterized membrane protein